MRLRENAYAVVPRAVYEFLSQCLPFNDLDSQTLEDLSRHCLLACFPRGTIILKQGGGHISHVYLIRTGGVRISMTTDQSVVTLKEYGGQGESFGGLAALQDRPVEFDVETVEDTFCFLIAKEYFVAMVNQSPRFADHYRETMSEHAFGAVYAEQRSGRVGARSEQSLHLFNARVLDIVKEPPETVPISASVQEVGTIMAARGVTSVLVQNPEGAIVGLLTTRELKTRVVAAGLDYGTPVERVMVSPVKKVPALALCFEALLTMIREQVDQLAVQHRGEIVGMINSRDMMISLGSSPLYLFREIAVQRTIQGLNELAQQMPILIRRLVEAGARAANICQMITVFTDNLLDRILALAQEELGPPPCSFCWLGLGTEGRREQTFRTDQDNALVFEALQERSQLVRAQEYFLALARKVVNGLEYTGHPRCRNDFMASNPRWCQDIGTWERYFSDWIVKPKPRDIFLTMIFFDFRAVAGNTDLAEELRTQVLSRIGLFPKVLKFLVRYFLHNEPPVSFFADFLVEKDDAKTEVLDLKTRTLTPFVEFARIMALRHGVHETNTLDRLAVLASRGHIPPDLYVDASQAYEFDLHLTLLHRLKMVEQGRKPKDFVHPAELTELERRTLKFSFSVIERMRALVLASVP